MELPMKAWKDGSIALMSIRFLCEINISFVVIKRGEIWLIQLEESEILMWGIEWSRNIVGFRQRSIPFLDGVMTLKFLFIEGSTLTMPMLSYELNIFDVLYFFVFSPWETVHGSLLGLRMVVLNVEVEPEGQFHCEVRAASLRLLTHQEVRVRQAAGKEMLKIKKCLHHCY